MANKCSVRIGNTYWGEYGYQSFEKLKKQIADSIENLHPLNSSDEGAEEYRKRFRGKPIFIKHSEDKDYYELK
jgi:hypothetical protein